MTRIPESPPPAASDWLTWPFWYLSLVRLPREQGKLTGKGKLITGRCKAGQRATKREFSSSLYLPVALTLSRGGEHIREKPGGRVENRGSDGEPAGT